MSIMSRTNIWDPRSAAQKQQDQLAAQQQWLQQSLDQRDQAADLQQRLNSPPPADQQAMEQARAQQAADAARQDWRNRTLFGDKAADFMSLSIPGFQPGMDRRTGLPKYGKGTPHTTARAFIVGDKTKANPSGEEVVITSGPSMVIPRTAFTKGKAFGHLPPKQDGRTGLPKYGSGGVFDPANAAVGQYARPGLSPGQSLVLAQQEAAASGGALPMPRENQTAPSAPAPPGPRTAAFFPSPAPSAPVQAAAPQWGSSLARNYKPIGADTNPGGGMEWTGTGWAHAFKPRRTDQRRFLRSPQGTAWMMQEQSRDRAYDRHEAARREAMQTQRGWDQEDRATAKAERDAKDKADEEGIDSIIRSLAGSESALDPMWKDFVGAAKGTKAKQAALDIAIRHAMDKDAERRGAERDAAARSRAQEDFTTWQDVPGAPDYQMNRRGQTLPKAREPGPAFNPGSGWRPKGYQPDGQVTEWEREPAGTPKWEQDREGKWFYGDPKTGRPIYEDPAAGYGSSLGLPRK